MKRLILACLLILLAVSPCFAAYPMPSSYDEATYGTAGAGRDYTSLATWEADTDVDMVTATKGKVLTCYDDAAPYNDTVTLAGATTSSSYYWAIRAAAGDRGTATSGVRFEREVTAHGIVIRNDVANTGIYDLGIKIVNSSAGYAIGCFAAGASDNVKYIGCTFYDHSSPAAHYSNGIQFYPPTGTTNNYVINCLFTGINSGTGVLRGSILIYVDAAGKTPNLHIYNSTIVSSNTALNIYRSAGTLTINSKNCIRQDNSTDIYDGGSAYTHNQISNVTSGVTFAADGYSLAAADSGAINQGTSLSADGSFAFNYDIFGNSRPYGAAWDVGCHEYTPAATTWIPIVIMY